MRRVCVFSGSSRGRDQVHHDAAAALGRLLAARGIGLVFGGGRIGLMGMIADAHLEAGGEAIGVIPRMLMRKEIAHDGLTEMRVVETMHERKALMAELSDAFIALPGGIGTLEELFEVWTWGQLGALEKRCGVLNVAGFYDPLLGFLDGVVEAGFLTPPDRAMLCVAAEPGALLEALATPLDRPPPKWVELDDT